MCTFKNSSLGCEGPQFPHSAARCSSSTLMLCCSSLSLSDLAALFGVGTYLSYNCFHASPGARVGSSARSADTLSLPVHSLYKPSETIVALLRLVSFARAGLTPILLGGRNGPCRGVVRALYGNITNNWRKNEMIACRFCANVMACRIYIEIEKWDSLKPLILKAGCSQGMTINQGNKLLPRWSWQKVGP